MVPPPQPRTLPLFDPHSQPQSWNERMADGEFAVLYVGDPIPPPPSPNDIGVPSEQGSLGRNVAPTGVVLLFIDVGIPLNRAQRRRREQKS